jgi:hypothetical protein
MPVQRPLTSAIYSFACQYNTEQVLVAVLLNDLYAFDPAFGDWSQLADGLLHGTPPVITVPAAAAVGGSVYVIRRCGSAAQFGLCDTSGQHALKH